MQHESVQEHNYALLHIRKHAEFAQLGCQLYYTLISRGLVGTLICGKYHIASCNTKSIWVQSTIELKIPEHPD